MTLLVLKRASFCKTLGSALIHAATLKLNIPIPAVYRVGLLFVLRKFWLKYFSHVWHCIFSNFVSLVLKRNEKEKGFFCWEALACFGDCS